MSTAKKISWITTSLVFAGATIVLAGGAFADKPKPSPDRLTRAERDALQDQQHLDFEKARREVGRRMLPPTPPVTATAPAATQEVKVTIEHVDDGLIVFSFPYDPQLEPFLVQTYKVAKSREDALDDAIFGGRLFRQVPLAPNTDEQRFLRLVGKEVVVVMTTTADRVLVSDVHPAR